MSSKKKVAENLQKGLSKELAAINQYFLHALVAEDWGLNKLAVRMREEMGHAERFARRLVFLGENPEVMPEKPPHRAQELQDMFESDLRDEEDAIKFYTKACATRMPQTTSARATSLRTSRLKKRATSSGWNFSFRCSGAWANRTTSPCTWASLRRRANRSGSFAHAHATAFEQHDLVEQFDAGIDRLDRWRRLADHLAHLEN